MYWQRLITIGCIACGMAWGPAALVAADADAIRQAVTFYASFDEAVRGDFGGGALTPSTRTGVPGKPATYRFENGFDAKVFRIAKDQGIAGGALAPVDVLPDNGRIFFPLKGNLAYHKGGWDGTMSMWINLDPNQQLKTTFCDPIQITEKGAHDGALWFDFNNAKPRDMRMGAFPALTEGQKPIPEDDPQAPMVRVPKVPFRAGDWHHIVITWENLDSGKPNARVAFYVDGKLAGEVKDRAIAMNWDVDKAGIYTAINYVGLLDELALLNRALTAAEVEMLQCEPELFQPLKKTGTKR
ncbi:MAG: LamG-like jellyroll fold domain-containing protein [Gemmataceae bacterium]